uniref:Uncharacterized protein n=1 Tax=Oryza nivara TaxID=4536 RepID=A0A0E0J1Z8_ORYNI
MFVSVGERRECWWWLLVRGRKQETIEALRQITSLNGGEDITTWSFTMLDACALEASGEGMFATLRSICERRLAAITTASFGVGVVYYGMPLSVGSLSPNLCPDLDAAAASTGESPPAVQSASATGRQGAPASVARCSGELCLRRRHQTLGHLRLRRLPPGPPPPPAGRSSSTAIAGRPRRAHERERKSDWGGIGLRRSMTGGPRKFFFFTVLPRLLHVY